MALCKDTATCQITLHTQRVFLHFSAFHDISCTIDIIIFMVAVQKQFCHDIITCQATQAPRVLHFSAFISYYVLTHSYRHAAVRSTRCACLANVQAMATDFTFQVLVFGIPMPQYHWKGRVMIESKFCTPVTYKLSSGKEGEWWVTPYQVRVHVGTTFRNLLFRLYVDGVLVNWRVYNGEDTILFKGISGNNGTKELLFSIPTNNRKGVELCRAEKPWSRDMGTITVVNYEAMYRGSGYQHWKGVSFSTTSTTTRPTSREGKLLESIKPYDMFHIWDVGRELNRKCVEYHSASTLQDMGLSTTDINWGKPKMVQEF